MKRYIVYITLLLIVFGCGRKQQQRSLEEIINSGDLEVLRQKKDEYNTAINQLRGELAQVNAAINELDKDQKMPLVRSFVVKKEIFNHEVEVYANIKARQNLELVPEVAGKLKKILVKEGQRVKKGILLAKIDDAGLKDQLDQLNIQLQLAKTTFERTQRLWDQKIGSEMQYLEAKTRYETQEMKVLQMEKQLAKTKIFAPFSGVIDQIIAQEGDVVSPRATPILRIVNLNKMYVEASVPENYLSNITVGTIAEVYIPVLQQRQKTVIWQTGNYINPNNRTFRVEAPLQNPDGLIKPNLTAKLSVAYYSNPEALMVPLRVVGRNAKREPRVFKLKKSEEKNVYTAQSVFVKLGKSTEEKIEIINGLSQGDVIIGEGVTFVEDGQLVRLIK